MKLICVKYYDVYDQSDTRIISFDNYEDFAKWFLGAYNKIIVIEIHAPEKQFSLGG